LSLATSIDALAVGIAFALLKKPVLETAVVIGLVTASLSFLGIKGGHKLGEKFGKSMQAIGGLVLVSIGLKILIEHIFSH
ncbi:MAG: manganese efflux pump, partial [Mesotoga sp.]|nr:manganese efflux pump [Mesotoga sp.]